MKLETLYSMLRHTVDGFDELPAEEREKTLVASAEREPVADFQPVYPYEFRLLLALTGTADDERFFHERFAHLRLQGEWFRVEDDLANFICESGGALPTASLEAA